MFRIPQNRRKRVKCSNFPIARWSFSLRSLELGNYGSELSTSKLPPFPLTVYVDAMYSTTFVRIFARLNPVKTPERCTSAVTSGSIKKCRCIDAYNSIICVEHLAMRNRPCRGISAYIIATVSPNPDLMLSLTYETVVSLQVIIQEIFASSVAKSHL